MNNLVMNKRMTALVLLLVMCAFPAAAEDFGLNEKIGMVLQMLSSPWVKGVACIALIAEIQEFRDETDACVSRLADHIYITPLNNDECASYIHTSVSSNFHPLKTPPVAPCCSITLSPTTTWTSGRR
jgi:hypothetical protein